MSTDRRGKVQLKHQRFTFSSTERTSTVFGIVQKAVLLNVRLIMIILDVWVLQYKQHITAILTALHCYKVWQLE